MYLAVFTGASALITVDLLRRDPALLERRMKGGPMAEPRPAQRVIMLGASAGFVALLVVPALGHRFGWAPVPVGGVVAGDGLVAVGFCLIARVYRANTFTSMRDPASETSPPRQRRGGRQQGGRGVAEQGRHPPNAAAWSRAHCSSARGGRPVTRSTVSVTTDACPCRA